MLQLLGEATGVSRAYVFENRTDEESTLLTKQRQEWVTSGITSQIDNPNCHSFPWYGGGMERWADLLSQGQLVRGHVKDFPQSEQEILAPQDIHSILAVPIFVGREWFGFIGFDECSKEREWSAAEIEALKTSAGIFGHFIERKMAEQALQESEVRFRELAESLPNTIYEVDTKGTLTFVNHKAFDEFGYTKEDFDQGLNAIIMIAPEDRPRAAENIGKVISKGETLGINEYTALRKDGSTFPVLINSSPIFREEEVVGIRGYILDITKQKKAEEALRESERRFREFAESLPETIFEMNLDGRLTFVNRSAVNHFGYTREEFNRGLNVIDMLAPEDRQRATENIAQVLNDEYLGLNEYTALRKDGSTFPCLARSNVVFSEGKPVGLRGFIIDITERRRAEEALKKQASSLEEANTALKVLLRSREEDKQELEENLLANVKKLVLPVIEKLKDTRLDGQQISILGAIETSLNEIISPFANRLSAKYADLTPTEIEVANLIRRGKTTKEIAEIQRSSKSVIDFHRFNIRKKLGLNKEKINLRSYLLSLPE
jgi:PAS domain S-box-containing protein